jgi:hypothetical protein
MLSLPNILSRQNKSFEPDKMFGKLNVCKSLCELSK